MEKRYWKMDHYKILLELISNDRQKSQSFDDSLKQLMRKVDPLLSEEIKTEVGDNDDDTRTTYVKTVLLVLKSLKNTNSTESLSLMSVCEYKTVKTAIEIVASIGILGCLLPGIGVGIDKLCSRATLLENEELTDFQKYERLSATTRGLTECFSEISFRPAILPQIGLILGALFQLSYAPLMRPSVRPMTPENIESSKFKMTPLLYEKLTRDQKEFRERLKRLIDDCPRSLVVKESMVLLGAKNSPKWIRKRITERLIEEIVGANGILVLVEAVCGNDLDLGEHWDKLDVVAKLVATPHGPNVEEYYEAVCPQLINLLAGRGPKYSSTIANNCIVALYEINPSVCLEKVIRKIGSPLKVNSSDATDTNISDCIEKLSNCFIGTNAKFSRLPCELMSEIAMPLFCLHAKARSSIFQIRITIKNLLVNILKGSKSRERIFSTFLEYNTTDFGEKMSFRFGSTGEFQVARKTEEDLDYDVIADSLYDLVVDTENLALDLFNHLLQHLSSPNKKTIGMERVLETSEDTLDRIRKDMAIMKLLADLSSTKTVRDALKKNSEPLLTFVKNLFITQSYKSVEHVGPADEEGNIEILYMTLMLLKVILTDNDKPKNWSHFNEFAIFLKNALLKSMPEQLRILAQELLEVIEHQGKSTTRLYLDMSLDGQKRESDFDKALRDLADPLLPVRAHGLMALTKLLEAGNPEAIAKKNIILCFFQENLRDEDSFVYLAAINGLCALACLLPEKVIEALVQEYIDMAQRSDRGEILSETRAKLGEILVKITRNLGDMAPAYKTVLINGFLCNARDSDDLVRASSLSCLGELCKVLGFRLGHAINEVIYCIGCIINSDKAPECRRAAVLVATLLIRGLGKDVLTDLGSDLLPLYRALKFLRDNDEDQILRLHAQLALEELTDIMQAFLFAAPDFEKRIFLLP